MSKSGIRRVRRTLSQWEALLAEQSRSGLTQDAFCRLRGLGYSTFSSWRARLSGKAAERHRAVVAPRAEFIELPAWPPMCRMHKCRGRMDAQERQPVAAGNDSALHIELELGNGMVLRIGRR